MTVLQGSVRAESAARVLERFQTQVVDLRDTTDGIEMALRTGEVPHSRRIGDLQGLRTDSVVLSTTNPGPPIRVPYVLFPRHTAQASIHLGAMATRVEGPYASIVAVPEDAVSTTDSSRYRVVGLSPSTSVSLGSTAVGAPPPLGSARWPQPCEAMFRFQARNQPSELAAAVRSGALRESLLSFAAEAIGEIADSRLAESLLVPLLSHPSRIVREGAVYGANGHLGSSEIRSTLERIAGQDESPAVRRAARDALLCDE